MKFWLAFPLFALAQASCYDYEYYDPVTQASIPGNACAQQAAAAGGVVAQPLGQPLGATSFATTTTTQFGQPTVFGSTSLPTYTTAASTQFAAPVPTYSTVPAYTSASLPTYTSAPVAQASYPTVYSSAPSYSTVYSSAPLAPSYAAVAQPAVYATTSYVAPAVVAAPVATTAVRASPVVTQTAARSPAQSSQAAELEYYKALGERQARQHRQNSRIVKEASEDLQKASLVNRIVAGAGNAANWFPAVRLSNQKEIAEAYRSEKQIAAKNAEDAYQRYLKDPTRLNLLVSKYQDLNADLRAAAHQYNVINAGTFGQNIAANALGFGSQFTITRLLSSRQQSDDLEDIQRQMKRIAREIQDEAQIRIAAAQGGSAQGSVQQRLMGMSQYGPQTQAVRG